MRVLVVDDSVIVRKIVTTLLTKWGFQVSEACDGADALNRLRAAPQTDLVMVDWNMPVMNGMTFVRNVRADSGFNRLPVMIMTTETEMAQALEERANEYLVKPFTAAMVQEKLAVLGFHGA